MFKKIGKSKKCAQSESGEEDTEKSCDTGGKAKQPDTVVAATVSENDEKEEEEEEESEKVHQEKNVDENVVEDAVQQEGEQTSSEDENEETSNAKDELDRTTSADVSLTNDSDETCAQKCLSDEKTDSKNNNKSSVTVIATAELDEEHVGSASCLIDPLRSLDIKCDNQPAARAAAEKGSRAAVKNAFRLAAMRSVSDTLDEAVAKNDATAARCSVQTCLKKFTAKETLADKIHCEHCSAAAASKVYARGLKQYLVCELPAVLTIHLKRFQQHGFRLEKNNKHVAFPLVLDMAPYTSSQCVNSDNDTDNDNVNSGKRRQRRPLLYALYALVEHSGRLNCGHYTAFVKAGAATTAHSKQTETSETPHSPLLSQHRLCHLNAALNKWQANDSSIPVAEHHIDDASNNSDQTAAEASAAGAAAEACKWYYISDSRVTEVSCSKVLSSQAYILFYERI